MCSRNNENLISFTAQMKEQRAEGWEMSMRWRALIIEKLVDKGLILNMLEGYKPWCDRISFTFGSIGGVYG